LGVGFFLAVVVWLVVFLVAGFLVLAALVLDFVEDLAVVFDGADCASFLAPESLDDLAPRTSLIALACSWSVILNS
jgi:hypothetical protein